VLIGGHRVSYFPQTRPPISNRSKCQKKFLEKMELLPPVLNGCIFITKEYIMKKIIRLTESDLTRIVKRVIKENEENLFHKKTNENGVFISVKETSDGVFELYISDENDGFGEVYVFEGDKGTAHEVFLQSKLHVQDGKSGQRVFKHIVDKLQQMG
jgi:hypothetical protein